MKIAVDLDDVVLDFVGGVLDAIKKEYAVEIAEDQVESFDLHAILDPIIGYSWWKWMREHAWIWPNFTAVDGAMGALRTLRNKGHYLVCITSKPDWAEQNVWIWLGKWRPPFQQVIITSKDDVKADFSDADVLIDDKVENVEAWAATGRKAILFDRSHNIEYEEPVGIDRAVGWGQVLSLIWFYEREQV